MSEFQSVRINKFYPIHIITSVYHNQGEICIYHPLKRLIRFEAYGILFVIAGFFGALLAAGRFDLSSHSSSYSLQHLLHSGLSSTISQIWHWMPVLQNPETRLPMVQ